MYAKPQIQERVPRERAAVCAEALEHGLDRLACSPRLADLQMLHDRGRLHGLLHTALEHVALGDQHRPEWLGSPWKWEPLLDDGRTRVGVWTLFPSNPLPIYDVPGVGGLYISVSGTVLQRRYRRSLAADLTEERAVTLRLVETRAISAGDWVDFGPDRNEIHCLAADHTPATLFQVLISPEQPAAARHWFLPIRPFGADEAEIHALPFRRGLRGFA
jgi:hypothetical protein